MNIYSLEPDANRYQNLELDRPDQDLEFLYSFNGVPVGRNWLPLSVKVIQDEGQNKHLPPGDFPAFVAPVFSGRAVEVLEPLLRVSGELLPLDCKAGSTFSSTLHTL